MSCIGNSNSSIVSFYQSTEMLTFISITVKLCLAKKVFKCNVSIDTTHVSPKSKIWLSLLISSAVAKANKTICGRKGVLVFVSEGVGLKVTVLS